MTTSPSPYKFKTKHPKKHETTSSNYQTDPNSNHPEPTTNRLPRLSNPDHQPNPHTHPIHHTHNTTTQKGGQGWCSRPEWAAWAVGGGWGPGRAQISFGPNRDLIASHVGFWWTLPLALYPSPSLSPSAFLCLARGGRWCCLALGAQCLHT